MTIPALPTRVDAGELERKVKDMYTQVALDPDGPFHFEMGRDMARRLGYTDAELDDAPAEAVRSFAGAGYYFDLANLHPGRNVTCNATLWAAHIGGAMQRDAYVAAIEQAGFTVTAIKANDEYRFLSKSAQGATRTYGVRSVSLVPVRN